jgi:hypothetical protein
MVQHLAARGDWQSLNVQVNVDCPALHNLVKLSSVQSSTITSTPCVRIAIVRIVSACAVDDDGRGLIHLNRVRHPQRIHQSILVERIAAKQGRAGTVEICRVANNNEKKE